MPRSVLVLNLGMAGLSVFSSILIGQALFAPDAHPPSRVVRPVAVTSPRNQDVATNLRSREVYDVIATRTLFHPNRAEPTRSEAIAPILPPAPALALHGVVINDDTRLAYLQDLATKQIFGYKTGDKLGGGQVERIEPDRVVIMRADGPLVVLLHRSKEPQPVVPSPQEDSPRRSRGRQE
jgi:type II secretory pathway component PulC